MIPDVAMVSGMGFAGSFMLRNTTSSHLCLTIAPSKASMVCNSRLSVKIMQPFSFQFVLSKNLPTSHLPLISSKTALDLLSRDASLRPEV